MSASAQAMSANTWQSLVGWVSVSLKRKVALALAATLTIASLCFLALLVLSYRARVIEERSSAATELNRLLQAGLENAMLKRDLDGLRRIVADFGRQERIAGVMILAPTGEVRFASKPALVGRRFDLGGAELCTGCSITPASLNTVSAFMPNAAGASVMRSINPVRNKEPCTECHGTVAAHPINGILVVDYDAAQIEADTLKATLLLSSAGLIVLLGAIGAIGWMLSRMVLAPVAMLTHATETLSATGSGSVVPIDGRDEMARLGRAFGDMARRIAGGVKALEAREHYLQRLTDAIPDGVRVLRTDYIVVQANAAFCAQQGLALADVVGKPCYVSSHGRTEPCPPTLISCPLHEIGKGAARLTCRQRHLRRDGAELPVEISAAPLEVETPEGTQRLVIEVVRDLSREMRISQEQRLSEIGLLAAGVAHEIHNPLTSVRLAFASLDREMATGQGANVADYLRLIEDEIDRCIDVTSRLLKLSAPPLDFPELVTVAVVVSEVLSLLRAEAAKCNVALLVDVPDTLRVIASDSELRMVVFNLAQNALHAMPKGGKLSVEGRLAGGSVLLSFIDNGVGIRAEDLGRIFDPFWSRRADDVHGTGLGLSICREIVKRHGGHIDVASKLGEGTRFDITLPSADAEVENS